MLNCTDLACVLHHHHFYAHLHHLKHHLQDDGDSSGFEDGSNIDNNDNTKPTINDTDSDLSSLSHVDAPNEVIYIVCGVVIAMLLVGVIIIIVAVTINKLRKRDETSSSVTTAGIEAQQQQQQQQQPHCESTGLGLNGLNGLQMRTQTQSPVAMSALSPDAYTTQDNNNISRAQRPQETTLTTTTAITELHISEANNNGKACVNGDHVTFTRTSGIGPGSDWTFPPKAPVPNIYHCFNPDMLVGGSDKNGFKGFRKQFSGRFKRLVARKPDPVPVIPPELKPQLKTIYVY